MQSSLCVIIFHYTVIIFLYIFYILTYTDRKERGDNMARTENVNFRLDSDVKRSMEQACSEMGLTLTAAFTIFAKKVSRERRIPFEVSADPFYSDSNMAHLRRGVAALNAGKGVSHDLIEDDDNE